MRRKTTYFKVANLLAEALLKENIIVPAAKIPLIVKFWRQNKEVYELAVIQRKETNSTIFLEAVELNGVIVMEELVYLTVYAKKDSLIFSLFPNIPIYFSKEAEKLGLVQV